jgi:mRNA interferase RelE/StbE
MKVEFRSSFLRSIKKIKNKELQNDIFNIITHIEEVKQFSEIKNIKKLSGFNFFYRIRLGNYRIGLSYKNNTITFVEFDKRSDIYKKFP